MVNTIEVAALNYYPIKACGAIEADEVSFTEFGIKYDREWMLVGTKGQFLSQRTHPELARVETCIEEGALLVNAPEMGQLAVSLERDPDSEIVSVDLWKKPGTGRNEGDEAASYFSEYLGKEARLLRIEQPRWIKPECRVDGASRRTAFADGFPILLTSNNSLDKLNQQLSNPITMDRFRPNIVVKGTDAYDEDYWRELQIGDLRAFVIRACARCPVPNIDQKVGELPKPVDRVVTAALRETRHGIDLVDDSRGDFFGQNVTHVFELGTTVSVGDPVTVLRRAAVPNWQTV